MTTDYYMLLSCFRKMMSVPAPPPERYQSLTRTTIASMYSLRTCDYNGTGNLPRRSTLVECVQTRHLTLRLLQESDIKFVERGGKYAKERSNIYEKQPTNCKP